MLRNVGHNLKPNINPLCEDFGCCLLLFIFLKFVNQFYQMIILEILNFCVYLLTRIILDIIFMRFFLLRVVLIRRFCTNLWSRCYVAWWNTRLQSRGAWGKRESPPGCGNKPACDQVFQVCACRPPLFFIFYCSSAVLEKPFYIPYEHVYILS